MNVESISLSAIVQFLVCTAVVWLARLALKNSDARIVHDALITRLESDRVEMNKRIYDLANHIHTVMGKQGLQEMRMDRDDVDLAGRERRDRPTQEPAA